MDSCFLLKKVILLIFFCQLSKEDKDILELFRPNPKYPKQLNEFYASVQRHKGDLNFIREVAKDKIAQNREIELNKFDYERPQGIEFEDEYKDLPNHYYQKRDRNDFDTFNVNKGPTNDIYPYMYKRSRNSDSYKTNEGVPEGRYKRFYKRKIHRKPVRYRRGLRTPNFDGKIPVEVLNSSNLGEIQQIDEKYPDRVNKKRALQNSHPKTTGSTTNPDKGEKMKTSSYNKDFKTLEKNNFTDKPFKVSKNHKTKVYTIKNIFTTSKPPKHPLKDKMHTSVPTVTQTTKQHKREIEIDVKSNGNLIKQIRQDSQHPKSVVLTFSSSDISKNDPAPNNQIEPVNFEGLGNDNNLNNLDLYGIHECTTTTCGSSSSDSSNMIIMYQGDPAYNRDNFQLTTVDVENVNIPKDGQNIADLSLVNPICSKSSPVGNMEDMSKSWSDTEKSQLKNGIEFAMKNDKTQKIPDIDVSIKMKNKYSDEADFPGENGFERVDSLQLHPRSKEEDKVDYYNEDDERMYVPVKRDNYGLKNNEVVKDYSYIDSLFSKPQSVPLRKFDINNQEKSIKYDIKNVENTDNSEGNIMSDKVENQILTNENYPSDEQLNQKTNNQEKSHTMEVLKDNENLNIRNSDEIDQDENSQENFDNNLMGKSQLNEASHDASAFSDNDDDHTVDTTVLDKTDYDYIENITNYFFSTTLAEYDDMSMVSNILLTDTTTETQSDEYDSVNVMETTEVPYDETEVLDLISNATAMEESVEETTCRKATGKWKHSKNKTVDVKSDKSKSYLQNEEISQRNYKLLKESLPKADGVNDYAVPKLNEPILKKSVLDSDSHPQTYRKIYGESEDSDQENEDVLNKARLTLKGFELPVKENYNFIHSRYNPKTKVSNKRRHKFKPFYEVPKRHHKSKYVSPILNYDKKSVHRIKYRRPSKVRGHNEKKRRRLKYQKHIYPKHMVPHRDDFRYHGKHKMAHSKDNFRKSENLNSELEPVSSFQSRQLKQIYDDYPSKFTSNTNLELNENLPVRSKRGIKRNQADEEDNGQRVTTENFDEVKSSKTVLTNATELDECYSDIDTTTLKGCDEEELQPETNTSSIELSESVADFINDIPKTITESKYDSKKGRVGIDLTIPSVTMAKMVNFGEVGPRNIIQHPHRKQKEKLYAAKPNMKVPIKHRSKQKLKVKEKRDLLSGTHSTEIITSSDNFAKRNVDNKYVLDSKRNFLDSRIFSEFEKMITRQSKIMTRDLSNDYGKNGNKNFLHRITYRRPSKVKGRKKNKRKHLKHQKHILGHPKDNFFYGEENEISHRQRDFDRTVNLDSELKSIANTLILSNIQGQTSNVFPAQLSTVTTVSSGKRSVKDKKGIKKDQADEDDYTFEEDNGMGDTTERCQQMKKSDNELANPKTTTESDDYYSYLDADFHNLPNCTTENLVLEENQLTDELNGSFADVMNYTKEVNIKNKNEHKVAKVHIDLTIPETKIADESPFAEFRSKKFIRRPHKKRKGKFHISETKTKSSTHSAIKHKSKHHKPKIIHKREVRTEFVSVTYPTELSSSSDEKRNVDKKYFDIQKVSSGSDKLVTHQSKLALRDATEDYGEIDKLSKILLDSYKRRDYIIKRSFAKHATNKDDTNQHSANPLLLQNLEHKRNISDNELEVTNIVPVEFFSKQENCDTTSPATEMVETTTRCDSDARNMGKAQQKELDENEKLDDILSCELPVKIVSHMYDHISSSEKLKSRFQKGMSRKFFDKICPDESLSQFRSNETHEDVEELHNLLKTISKIMSKLVMSHVEKAICQHLSPQLGQFLTKIVTVPKEDNVLQEKAKQLEGVSNYTAQSNFLFENENIPQSDNRKVIKKEILQRKVETLRKLLDKYNTLDPVSKDKASPVKGIIVKHLELLSNMLPETRAREIPNETERELIENTENENELIERELESVGLGKKHEFHPNFDLEELVEMTKRNQSKYDTENKLDMETRAVRLSPFGGLSKTNIAKRDVSTINTSDKYRKLLNAAQVVRNKRENQKKIGKIFGGPIEKQTIEDKSKSKEIEDISKVKFESPVVYSM